MGRVYTSASMSLDGFISGPGESGFEHLFDWYGNGEVELPTPQPEMTLKLTQASAEHWKWLVESTGAIVCGRKIFDLMDGWGGRHPLGVPTVVVTHNAPAAMPHFDFVTDGIEAAVAKAHELAGDRMVAVNGGTIARQCLDAGLLDEVWIDLVPVLLGAGVPFFEQLKQAPVVLDGPVSVEQGNRVTHLRYRVRK